MPRLIPDRTSRTRSRWTHCDPVGDAPGQVYACLWSHADRKPGHIHFVLQPVGEAVMEQYDAHGPALQVRMLEAGDDMEPGAIVEAAERIRAHLLEPVRAI